MPNSELQIEVIEMKNGQSEFKGDSSVLLRPYYAVLIEKDHSRFHVANMTKNGSLVFKNSAASTVGGVYIHAFVRSEEFKSVKDELWEFVKAQQIVTA